MKCGGWRHIAVMAAIACMFPAACCAGIWDDVSENFWKPRDGYLLQWVYMGGDLPSAPETGAVTDNEDSNKKVEMAKGGKAGMICFGPYSSDQGAGHYRAVFRLKASGNTLNDAVARIDVSNHGGRVITQPVEVKGKDFLEAGSFQEFTVDFEIPKGVESGMEYRVYWTGRCDLRVDTIKIFQKQDEIVLPLREDSRVKIGLEGRKVLFYTSFDKDFNPDYAVGYARGVPRNKLSYVPGKKANAISLTGGSCYYAGEGNIDPSSGTMMVWAKTAVPADELRTDAIMQAKELMLYYHPTMKAFGFFINGLFYSSGVDAGMWPAETWHHVAVTWDKTGGREFYLDGVRSSATGEPSGMSSCDIFSIGKGDPGSWQYFRGALDEMYIFDGVLSAGDIKLMYQRQSASEKEIDL